ncbi:MAG: hypothetical protein AAF654_00965 [Myxococcota bacterium]
MSSTAAIDNQRLPIDPFTYRDQQFQRSLTPKVLAGILQSSDGGWTLTVQMKNPLDTPLSTRLRSPRRSDGITSTGMATPHFGVTNPNRMGRLILTPR